MKEPKENYKKNPEGFNKEQIKKINKDQEKQKLMMDAAAHDKWLAERQKDMENAINSLQPIKNASFVARKNFAKIKNNFK